MKTVQILQLHVSFRRPATGWSTRNHHSLWCSVFSFVLFLFVYLFVGWLLFLWFGDKYFRFLHITTNKILNRTLDSWLNYDALHALNYDVMSNSRRTLYAEDAKAVRLLQQYFFFFFFWKYTNIQNKVIPVLLGFCCPILYRTFRILSEVDATKFRFAACFLHQNVKSRRQKIHQQSRHKWRALSHWFISFQRPTSSTHARDHNENWRKSCTGCEKWPVLLILRTDNNNKFEELLNEWHQAGRCWHSSACRGETVPGVGLQSEGCVPGRVTDS